MVELTTLQAVSYIMGSLGVFVAAVYYVGTLRNNQRTQQLQLETRQAQLFMQIYSQSHNDPTFLDAWRKVMSLNWGTYEELMNLQQNEENIRAIQRVQSFYEGLGVLVKAGFIDIRLVALLMTIMTRIWWEKYKPIIEEARRQMGYPRYLSESEYLYNELMKYIAEHPELTT
jgi:hypothetical protein